MISRRTRGSPRTNKYTEIHFWLGQLLSCELLVLLTACNYTEQGGLLVCCVIFIFSFCPPESVEPGGTLGFCKEGWVYPHPVWHRVTDACSVLSMGCFPHMMEVQLLGNAGPVLSTKPGLHRTLCWKPLTGFCLLIRY